MMPYLTAALRFWREIAIAALLIGLLATRATVADVKAARDLSDAKLAISNASIERLEGELKKALTEQISLAKGDASRVQASRETLKVVAAASEWREAATERLLASAGAIRPDPPAGCTVSDTVADIWK